MSWSQGFQDPAEARAAAEAADRMNAAQAGEDARTEALAAAIVEGFSLVASAVLTASGHRPMMNGLGQLAQGDPEGAAAEPPDSSDPLGDLLGDDEGLGKG